jgi:uncharacterized membrane protein YgdD (TMEM256/DUF423 family)
MSQCNSAGRPEPPRATLRVPMLVMRLKQLQRCKLRLALSQLVASALGAAGLHGCNAAAIPNPITCSRCTLDMQSLFVAHFVLLCKQRCTWGVEVIITTTQVMVVGQHAPCKLFFSGHELSTTQGVHLDCAGPQTQRPVLHSIKQVQQVQGRLGSAKTSSDWPDGNLSCMAC